EGKSVSNVVPGLTSQVWGDEDEGKSFDEICAQRSPILGSPGKLAPMSRFSLASNKDESRWIVLIRTCGYIDVAVLSREGRLIDRTTLFEPKFEEDVIRVFLALSAELKSGDGGVLSEVMVED